MISLKNTNKILIALTVCTFISTAGWAQTLTTKSARVNFFSSTPIEDIKAASAKGTVVFIPTSGDIAFQIPVKSFEFARGLMQEHFNENYMESDKFPYAKFTGKISPSIDLSKDGEYPVIANGMLLIHGVSKQRSIAGKLRVVHGKVQLLSSFDVTCADHNIKIPRIVMTKVAEVIKVNTDAILNP